MAKEYLIWTEEEISILNKYYLSKPKEFLIERLRNRKWEKISKKACKLNLYKEQYHKANIETLLEDTPEAYYWIGFLMADGHFTDRRIALGVAKKDLNHLKKFAKFIKSSNLIYKYPTEDYYRLRSTCVDVVKKLKEKFSISNRKTYEPCKIDWIKNDNLLFSLFVGFFDGDGGVYNWTLNIVGHTAWIDNFTFMKKFIFRLFDTKMNCELPKIEEGFTCLPQDKTKTKKKYYATHLRITRKGIIEKIKEKADELKLPYLKRKLGKIKV